MTLGKTTLKILLSTIHSIIRAMVTMAMMKPVKSCLRHLVPSSQDSVNLRTGIFGPICVHGLAGRQVGAVTERLERRQEQRGNQAQRRRQLGPLKRTVEETWHIGLDGLRDEAARPRGVREVVDAVDEAAAEIAEVEAGEGVDGARVAADLAVGRIRRALLCRRDGNVGQRPRVILGALVVVVRDALAAGRPHEVVAGVSGVAPEREEVLLRLEAARVLGRVVR